MNPFTQLLSDARQHLSADAFLADIPIIIEGEGRALAVVTRSRTANVAKLVFTAAHKLKSQGLIRVEDMADESYNAERIAITVTGPNEITYASNGADEAATAEASGIITPLLVPISESIENGLAQGGLLRGPTNKGGLAILLMIHKGVPLDQQVSGWQAAQMRVSLFCSPLLNARGLKKPPLDVHAAIISAMVSWDRGAGAEKPQSLGWDSRENTEGDLAWFSDFNLPQML